MRINKFQISILIVALLAIVGFELSINYNLFSGRLVLLFECLLLGLFFALHANINQTTSNKNKYLALMVLAGIFLGLGFPPLPFVSFMFVCFVPLLWLENKLSTTLSNKDGIAKYAYLFFLTWNVFSTWWVANSTLIGGLVAIFANSALMLLPFLLFVFIKRATKHKIISYISFICAWLSFEYLHLHWDFSWPWLTLGNSLAMYPKIMQWYEFTGVFGGSLWILLINTLLADFVIANQINSLQSLKNAIQNLNIQNRNKHLKIVFLSLTIPLLLSLVLYYQHKTDEGVLHRVAVVQPNIDPFLQKFDEGSKTAQYKTLKTLAEQCTDLNSEYIAFPETALPFGIWLNDINHDPYINALHRDMVANAALSPEIIMGVSSFKSYTDSTLAPIQAFKDQLGNFITAYNGAVQIDARRNYKHYAKSKLVVGTELVPYLQYFPFLKNYLIDLGGTSASLGVQAEQTPFFKDIRHDEGVAPIICYESIYGEFVSRFAKNGAQFLLIITNDGWWGNTAGHKQHLYFASLRAIETRRGVARSANTGVSAFINQRGDILETLPYEVQGVLVRDVAFNTKHTVYTLFGDYIAKISLVFIGLILLFAVYCRFKLKNN